MQPIRPAGTYPVLPKEPANIDFEGTVDAKIKADDVDVDDLYRANGPVAFDRRDLRHSAGPLFAPPDFKYNLCGMHLIARAAAPGGTERLEWDLKLSVVMEDKARIAGFAVGSFSLKKEPVPRRPIANLRILLDGVPEPASARIIGSPNATGGVDGAFPEPFAENLFEALDAGTPLTLDLTYHPGEHETVTVPLTAGSGLKKTSLVTVQAHRRKGVFGPWCQRMGQSSKDLERLASEGARPANGIL